MRQFEIEDWLEITDNHRETLEKLDQKYENDLHDLGLFNYYKSDIKHPALFHFQYGEKRRGLTLRCYITGRILNFKLIDVQRKKTLVNKWVSIAEMLGPERLKEWLSKDFQKQFLDQEEWDRLQNWDWTPRVAWIWKTREYSLFISRFEFLEKARTGIVFLKVGYLRFFVRIEHLFGNISKGLKFSVERSQQFPNVVSFDNGCDLMVDREPGALNYRNKGSLKSVCVLDGNSLKTNFLLSEELRGSQISDLNEYGEICRVSGDRILVVNRLSAFLLEYDFERKIAVRVVDSVKHCLPRDTTKLILGGGASDRGSKRLGDLVVVCDANCFHLMKLKEIKKKDKISVLEKEYGAHGQKVEIFEDSDDKGRQKFDDLMEEESIGGGVDGQEGQEERAGEAAVEIKTFHFMDLFDSFRMNNAKSDFALLDFYPEQKFQTNEEGEGQEDGQGQHQANLILIFKRYFRNPNDWTEAKNRVQEKFVFISINPNTLEIIQATTKRIISELSEAILNSCIRISDYLILNTTIREKPQPNTNGYRRRWSVQHRLVVASADLQRIHSISAETNMGHSSQIMTIRDRPEMILIGKTSKEFSLYHLILGYSEDLKELIPELRLMRSIQLEGLSQMNTLPSYSLQDQRSLILPLMTSDSSKKVIVLLNSERKVNRGIDVEGSYLVEREGNISSCWLIDDRKIWVSVQTKSKRLTIYVFGLQKGEVLQTFDMGIRESGSQFRMITKQNGSQSLIYRIEKDGIREFLL